MGCLPLWALMNINVPMSPVGVHGTHVMSCYDHQYAKSALLNMTVLPVAPKLHLCL